MTESQGQSTRPKSMRHKQVLDVAAENPDASLDDIAAAVPSATVDLVERVLEEYGDSAADDDETAADEAAADDSTAAGSASSDEHDATAEPTDDTTNGTTMTAHETDPAESDESTDTAVTGIEDTAIETDQYTNGAGESVTDDADDAAAGYPDPDELSAKQRETLRAIAANPDATQRQLAEELDVTAATVSSRANSIDGFDWDERQSFVEAVFDEASIAPADTTESQLTPTDLQDSIDDLTARVDALETTLAERTAAADAERGVDDPELVHKAIRACVHADDISEDEERRIVRTLLE